MKSIKFLDACKGMMYLLIGIGIASFGIASISGNTVKADNPTITNNTGKIMMSEGGFVIDGKPNYHVLVWDTETGKSKLYFFNYGKGLLGTTNYQLPSSPLY
jgi:hypothetical protein